MKYTIKYANGNSLIVDSATVNNNTSIPMVGTDNSSFGNIFWSDLLHILENFASPFSPTGQTKGQTWYDNKNKLLNIYDGSKWNVIENSIPDLTNYTPNNDGVLKGALSIKLSETAKSVATRKYVESLKFKFKQEANSNVSYVVYDNDYAIINFIIYPEAGGLSSSITLPFNMADTNYSILLSVNSSANEVNTQLHFNTANKTINSFDVHCSKEFSSMACVIMGFKAK